MSLRRLVGLIVLTVFLVANSPLAYAFTFLKEDVYEKAIKKFFVVPPKGTVKIVPKRLSFKPEKVKEAEEKLKKLTPEEVLKAVPKKCNGGKFYFLPVKYLYFLPFREYYIKWWEEAPNLKILVLTKGNFSLEWLWKKIKNDKVIEKDGDAYILKVPVIVARGANLVIRNTELRMALEPGCPILVIGKIFIISSKVVAWDTKNNKFSPLPHIAKENFYLYGTQKQRPYILAIRSGKLIIVDSYFSGLGYKGLFSSFGLGLNTWVSKKLKVSPVVKLLDMPVSREQPELKRVNKLVRSLLEQEYSTGIFLGNDIIANYMGFYSNEARNVVFVGNYVKDNALYNYDPHDWTKNQLVAYNVFENAGKAHGLIFSRFTTGVVIGNVSVGNHGAGIMMDRKSEAIIYRNVVFGNRLGGISLLESDRNFIVNNVVTRNRSYGIYLRNSLDVFVKGNRIFKNPSYGFEVAAADIGYQIYRNLYTDPYHMAASAWLEENDFHLNFAGEVMVANGGAIALYKNEFYPQPRLFMGDISKYTDEIMRNQDKEPVVIPGYGILEERKKVRPDVSGYLERIELNLVRAGNDESRTAIGVLKLFKAHKEAEEYGESAKTRAEKREGIKWLLSAASRGETQGLVILGANSLVDKKLQEEGIMLVAEAAVLGSVNARYILFLLPVFSEVSRKEVNSYVDKAIERIENGKLVDCALFGAKNACFKVGPKEREFFRKQILNFKRQFSLSGSRDYWEFFRKNVEDVVTTGYKKKVDTLKVVIVKKNAGMRKYINWEKERFHDVEIGFLEGYPELVRYIRKNFATIKAWTLMLKQDDDADFKQIEKDVRQNLEKMNLFRLRKVDVDKLMNHLRQGYFNAQGVE
ncbi:right-handed parallel beta-helix repeat-containing protein [Phorcysia thermohydrogeniphila]|uniref:Poly(Beta-D-mannuronate) C5 epimerase n=1 Tax=Phorcysia thermohydrogeniphila TaxID=936138 RepID=A0A4R1GBV4_9BACT|nr:right-handed parallel beta-helix repeat-containing protein [Phorcysia thermohydrogeniphila]TCK05278.1 poly(beta-D-mannuronate) C5 epimerase [Phorcysia thermohydrogeniphila]